MSWCDTDLTSFWEVLSCAKMKDDSRILSLADGTQFFAFKGMGSAIFVRDCYEALAEEALSMKPPSDDHRAPMSARSCISQQQFLLHSVYKQAGMLTKTAVWHLV